MNEKNKQEQSNTSPEAYQRDYARRLLDRPAGQMEAPDQSRCNGTLEPLRAVWEVHREHGPKAAAKALDAYALTIPAIAALLAPPKRKRLYHASELADLPPVEYMAGGELVARGLNYLYGPSGAHKSFISLDDYALPIAQNDAVVYVAGEGESGYWQRVSAWQKFHQQGLGKLHFWLDPVLLLNSGEIEEFIAAIHPLKPKLIIFDTLATCMAGGDVNNGKDVGIVRDNCRKIIRETGAAVLIIHHTGKDTSRGLLGHSDLRNSADMVIKVKDRDGATEIECDKVKDARPFETRYVRPEEVNLGNGQLSLVMVATERGAQIVAELSRNQRAVLETLNQETMRTAGGRVTTVAELSELGRSSVYSALNALMKRGYVNQHEKGDPFYITESGEEALKPPKIVNLALPGQQPAKRNKKPKANPFSTPTEGVS